jgi:CRISPR/Cas system-associated exonuclease Cas4 (RecB family)
MLADIIPKIAGQFDNEDSRFNPRPSLAGPDRCTRQMVYWGLEIPREPFPGRAMLVFNDSSWHEELTADWIRKSAFQLHSEQMEVKVSSPGFDFELTGHIDGIITDIMGEDFLWEHKAINHFTFQMYWDREIPADYIAQTCCYIRGAQSLNPNLNKAVLLIKNKNTAQYLEYLIYYDSQLDRATVVEIVNSKGDKKVLGQMTENIIQSVFKKFQDVKTCIKDRRLPKRDYFIDNWHCEYCGWGKVCWEGYQKEFKELRTGEMLPGEIADMLRYYKELGGQKSDIEKEYKSLSEKVKATMKEIGAREGKAGEYLCKLNLIETNRLDKELLTQSEIEKATVKGFQERLYVIAPKKMEVQENV